VIRFSRALCCFAAFALAASTGFSQSEAFHVLAFYSTNVEQDHVDFAQQAIPFFKDLAKKDHFDFETTSNWDDMNPTLLKRYQVVLWLDDAPSKQPQRAAFQDYMEHGGAWLGPGSQIFSAPSSTETAGLRCPRNSTSTMPHIQR
jgi:hypothetical protein